MKIIGKTLQTIEEETKRATLQLEEESLLQELADTDWYVTRYYESNKEIPNDVKEKRTYNRSRINEIRKILSGEFI